MSPTDAIQMLDQAVAQVPASREVHVRLQQAVQLLQELVESPPVKKDK